MSDFEVCARNTTYAEFRKQRLALETCFEANRPWLGAATNRFPTLSREMALCDTIFLDSIKYPDYPATQDFRSNAWFAVTQLQPAVLRAALDDHESRSFVAGRAVKFQLAEIAGLCEQLIQSE